MNTKLVLSVLQGMVLGGILMGSGPAPEEQGAQDVDTSGARPLTTSERIKAARLDIKLQGDLVAGALALANALLAGTGSEMRVERVQKDDLGFTHVRLRQYYKGVLVEGSGQIMHITGDSVLYHVDGTARRRFRVSVVPTVSAERVKQLAVEDAVKTRCLDQECARTDDEDDSWEVPACSRAEGSDTGGINAGHRYSAFDGIGVAGAARVAMRANLYYLDDFSVFADIRRAWLLSAQDLVDAQLVPEHAVAAVESAMVAVGIGRYLRFRHGSAPQLQLGMSGNMLLQGRARDSSSLMGLVMRHTSTKGASLRTDDTVQFRVSGAVLDYSAAYLASADSLAGDLVFRGPDGVVQMAIDPNGSAHIRVRDRWDQFVDPGRGL